MGQMKQTSDDLTEHEEQDRRAAGYIDEPKNESYLPSSVHGSPHHMAALVKNALMARGSTATGGTTTAMGNRATGGTTMRQNEGDGRHNDAAR